MVLPATLIGALPRPSSPARRCSGRPPRPARLDPVTTTATRPRPRWHVVLLAALTAILALLLAAAPASAAYAPAAETRLGVFDPAVTVVVWVHECIPSGQRPVRGPSQLQVVSGSCVAAEAGPRALPVGPWGQKVVDARDKLPSSWGPGNPNAKGVGTRWSDPSAPQTHGLRLDQGIPGSGWPSQQVDHVVVRSGGRILGPDGKPIVGSLRDNPQAHIPLSDWRNWASWNAP